jgi:hypothetical protein
MTPAVAGAARFAFGRGSGWVMFVVWPGPRRVEVAIQVCKQIDPSFHVVAFWANLRSAGAICFTSVVFCLTGIGRGNANGARLPEQFGIGFRQSR